MNKTKMFAGVIISTLMLISMQVAALAEDPKPVLNEPQVSSADGKYEALLKEFEALKLDRDNVLAQTKRLLEGKTKLIEMEESRALWQSEKQALSEKSTALEADNKKLEEETAQFKLAQDNLSQELAVLKKDNEALQKGTAVSEMQNKMADLQRDHEKEIQNLEEKYAPLRKYLQEAEKEIAKRDKNKEDTNRKSQEVIDKLKKESEKTKFRIEELNRRVSEDGKRIKEATNKNKSLLKEIKNMPKKFSEIARQNKMLIKETGEMHYNLGVFYTKNQEYERALHEFEKAADINSDNASAYFNLGYIYSEYLVNRKKAVENFRHYLQVSKGSDKDTNWVKKYLLTWDTYDGKDPIN